jgi:hypothetical protein
VRAFIKRSWVRHYVPTAVKRKTSIVPTRIYSYGCLPPTAGAELLDEQLRLAHRYRNLLVEIERTRRERVQAALRLAVEVDGPASQVEALVVELEALRRMLAPLRAHNGEPPEAEVPAARARAVRGELRGARELLRAAKRRVLGDDRLRLELRAADDEAKRAVQEARAASGLYWGTYLQIEAAAMQFRRGRQPPRFVPYDGSGKVAVQLQHGMPVAELFSGNDTRLRVQPLVADAFARARHQRRLAGRTVVWIRAGSEGPRHLPRWIELPLLLHRPLPDDAVIKWAWIIRRVVAQRAEHQLQLVVESPSFVPPEAPVGRGRVAVDLGWRNKPDGRVRVAYWRDDEGRSGELLVPARTQEGVKKPDELRAIRDQSLDRAKAALREWLASAGDVPEWLREATRALAHWRSPARLARLVQTWSERRLAGDEAIVEQLVAWAKQERHLRFWEVHQRDRRLGHRREAYRRFAVELARRYATVLLPTIDLGALRAIAPPEDARAAGRTQRRTARLAAPGELRAALREAAGNAGVALVELEAADRTRICAGCGRPAGWDARASLEVQCGQCGVRADQDENACLHLLAAHAATTPARLVQNRDYGDSRDSTAVLRHPGLKPPSEL